MFSAQRNESVAQLIFIVVSWGNLCHHRMCTVHSAYVASLYYIQLLMALVVNKPRWLHSASPAQGSWEPHLLPPKNNFWKALWCLKFDSLSSQFMVMYFPPIISNFRSLPFSLDSVNQFSKIGLPVVDYEWSKKLCVYPLGILCFLLFYSPDSVFHTSAMVQGLLLTS